MKQSKKTLLSRICLIAGVCLLIFAALGMLVWQWSIHQNAKRAKETADALASLLTPEGAVIEERRDNTMSTLSLNGTDFVGLIEMPKYSLTLPICNDWGSIRRYPCRFSGSVYDRTMMIGASSQKGQLDFYREISVGDSLLYTDMEGNRYAYTVSNIDYEKHADHKTLNEKDADLTLFIKNVYAFEYIVIRCSAA